MIKWLYSGMEQSGMRKEKTKEIMDAGVRYASPYKESFVQFLNR